MTTRTIAVGLSADPGQGRVDLVLLPSELGPPAREGLTVHAPEDLEGALHAMRHAFCSDDILSLAGTDVVGDANPEWTSAIESRIAQFVEDLGNSVYDCWEGARNVIRNATRFANAPTSDNLRNTHRGCPAICLAAGPSATPEMLARIRGLKSTHIVFSAEVMLGACKRAGFAPDFVSIIERPPGTTQFVKGLGADSTLIATAVVDPATVAEFPRVVWWRGGDRFYDAFFPGVEPQMAGRSTGVLSIAAAILAGCNPIYLVGHDLAYAPGHVSHCSSVHPEAPGPLAVAETQPVDCYGREQLTCNGWDGSELETNGFWQLFRLDIETIIRDAPPEVSVVSCQDWRGARIAGVFPGELPPARVRAPMLIRPPIPPSGTTVRTDLVASVLKDAAWLGEKAESAADILGSCLDKTLSYVAASLAISENVSRQNTPLFQYIFQTLNHALALRLAVRPETQRECLKLLAGNLARVCRYIKADLE